MEQEIEENKDGFIRYSSIENSYQEKFINFVAELEVEEWCISEKIHGSNSCISYKTTEDIVKFAKRSGYLENESFYNLEESITKVHGAIDRIRLCAENNGYESIEIFGEIFGGNYLHPEVDPVKNAKKVQKGVFYTPDNNFLAFDIRVDGEYVDVLKFKSLCVEMNIPYIPISIFRGNVYEAVSFCNKIKDTPSQIYKLYSLPEITDNIREGVVLKPIVTTRMSNGNRVIIKVKNDTFLEISKQHKQVIQKDLPEAPQNALNKLSEYSNEARLNNVISHLGEVTIKDFGQVIGTLLQDIYEDFIKDGNSLNELEKNERKIVNKRLSSILAPMVRKELMTR